jgi:hypothetical protein
MIKKLSLILFFFTVLGFSQSSPIDFETNGNGASWNWTVFENDSNPPLEIVANPAASGINTSATVARFTALQSGQAFAGVESMHGSDIGTFSINATNCIVKIMVWKTVISDVGIKFVTPSSASDGELKVSNTVTQQWEELTYDFSSRIGLPASTGIDQIVVFPDFDSRTSDNVIYFDAITFGDGSLGSGDEDFFQITAFPNPVKDFWNVEANDEILEMTIYTLFGRRLKTILPKKNSYSIDMSAYNPGIYLIRVVTKIGNKNIKLIKD